VIRSYANRLTKAAGPRKKTLGARGKAACVRDIKDADGGSGLPHGPARMQPASSPVRNWLIVVAGMIFFMIVLGALTRLT